jgi:hypothetical protein
VLGEEWISQRFGAHQERCNFLDFGRGSDFLVYRGKKEQIFFSVPQEHGSRETL